MDTHGQLSGMTKRGYTGNSHDEASTNNCRNVGEGHLHVAVSEERSGTHSQLLRSEGVLTTTVGEEGSPNIDDGKEVGGALAGSCWVGEEGAFVESCQGRR